MNGIVILDKSATTNPNHGSTPEERSVEQLLSAGWILIDKPAGPSSHQLAAWARDMLEVEKLGHGGTLDPFATGGLTLLSGSSMRLTGRILKGDKKYISILKIPKGIDDETLEKSISQLRGRIHNVPPIESAVKVQVRQRTIDSFEIIERDDRFILTSIECEAGTYVRTLARDLGLLLNGPVELTELRRALSGSSSENDAVTMQQLSDSIYLWKQHGDDAALKKMIQPIESLLSDLPSIVVKDGAVAALAHGAPLASVGVVSLDTSVMRGDEVLIKSLKGEAVAIAKMTVPGSDIPNMTGG
ncbi:MAG: RNA-guided pseudouridylation complex pseudouridine synthase subunit Cbf5, partial [Euryarchaeota archaeon]|nr:RNA-guided pseudouridylation complex pseudouridine synthase subunit Cbf5 [Euryarchaeota archaeon]